MKRLQKIVLLFIAINFFNDYVYALNVKALKNNSIDNSYESFTNLSNVVNDFIKTIKRRSVYIPYEQFIFMKNKSLDLEAVIDFRDKLNLTNLDTGSFFVYFFKLFII